MSQQDETSSRERSLLLLVDGHALVFRSWYAIQQPLIVRDTGEEVKGVYGFTNTFLRVLREWNPTHCAIAFDVKGPTFRDLKYDQYKATREAAPPELHRQVAHVHRLMEAFRVPIYEVEGYEADDVLGTLARQAESQGMEVVILTGDTDTFQLVTPSVRVHLQYRIRENKVFDEAAVQERFGGLGPDKQPDLKALSGDTSDNIPGVRGIGEKTAIKLILEYGSLEAVYENIDLLPLHLQDKLRRSKDLAFLSRELGKIVVDIPITFDQDTSRFWKYDRQEVVNFLRSLELFSIINRLPVATSNELVSQEVSRSIPTPLPDYSYTTVTTTKDLDVLIQELRKSNRFSLVVQPQLVGIAFSTELGHAWYVPMAHHEGDQLPSEEVLGKIGAVLEDPTIPKITHNATTALTLLLKNGIQVQNLAADTMVAAHLANQKALGLDALALSVLGHELPPIANLLGTGAKKHSLADVSGAEMTPYATAFANAIVRLRVPLEQDAYRKGGELVYTKAQLPLIPVLARMQANGITLDVRLLEEMSQELGEQLQGLETAIYTDVGHQFNINSPQQLSSVLFEELKLRKTKRTRTGAYTTDAAALEGLRISTDVSAEQKRILLNLLDHRQMTKLKSTYVDALPTLVDPKTGRLHTTYNPAGSATGRLASSDPNLMNIPIRTEQGKRVRQAFIAGAPNWLLLAADYSQIELRVLAYLSEDPALISAFERGEDIHAATASRMFHVPLDKVTPDMRRIAKVLNFGVIYGLSAFGVSQHMGFSVEEGNKFIRDYFDRYPGVHQYLEETKEKAHKNGYVETLLGRRRYLPEITSSNLHVRQAAERMAINTPVQGTAAEVIQIAMIQIDQWMQEHNVRSKMLLQVHDELIFEVPQEELDPMKDIVSKLMPEAIRIKVPLDVELKQGVTWGDME